VVAYRQHRCSLAPARGPPRKRRPKITGRAAPKPRHAHRIVEHPFRSQKVVGMFGYVASSGNTGLLRYAVELATSISAGLGESLRAARLTGAAEAIRQESGMLITQQEAHHAGGAPGPGARHRPLRKDVTAHCHAQNRTICARPAGRKASPSIAQSRRSARPARPRHPGAVTRRVDGRPVAGSRQRSRQVARSRSCRWRGRGPP
jgi:hypothetical protein